MKLSIAIPEKIIFTGEVENINISTFAGDIGVLPNHAALISVVKKGNIKIKTSQGEKIFDNEEGVIEIHNNQTSILLRGCNEKR